ncbi:alpha-glucosidase [compost metagenome]
MFGPDLLVAPVVREGQRSRQVYLPAGASWKNAYSGDTVEGGCTIKVEAPLERIPLFLKNGAELPILAE